MTDENNTPEPSDAGAPEPSVGAPPSEPSPGERVVRAATGSGAFPGFSDHFADEGAPSQNPDDEAPSEAELELDRFVECVEVGVGRGVVRLEGLLAKDKELWEELGFIACDEGGEVWLTLKGFSLAVACCIDAFPPDVEAWARRDSKKSES